MTISSGDITLILLTALLLTAVLILLTFGLEQLAQRNRRQTRHFRRQLARRQARLQQMQAQLQPYHHLASAAYRSLHAQTNEQLTAVAHTLRRLAAADPVLPAIPPVKWPIVHFLRRPDHAGAILRDWWLLRQANRDLQVAAAHTQQAAAQLQRLAALPAELRREAAALAQTIHNLGADIATEQAIQPANVGRLDQQQAALAEQTAVIQSRLAAPASTSQTDALATELDAVKEAANALAAELNQRREQRQQTSAACERSADRLGKLDRALQPHSHLPLINLLRAEAAGALDAAQQAAAAARWAQAVAALERADRWAQLGEQLLPPLTAVAQLAALQATSLQPQAIANLQANLDGQLATLHTTLSGADARQTTLSRHAEPLAAITQQVGALKDAYEKAWRQQADAAKKARRQLDQAWSAYQRHLSPAPDDPLRQQVSALHNRFSQPEDHPRGWAALADAARHAADDLRATTAYIQLRRKHVDKMLRASTAHVEDAEAWAGPWRCLADERRMVQETAVFLQQFAAEQRQIKRLGDLHALFDRAKQAWLDADDALATLRRQGERLNTLHGRIHRIRQTADSHADALGADPQREAALQEVIDDLLEDAFHAGHVDDALHALERAESYLEKLF